MESKSNLEDGDVEAADDREDVAGDEDTDSSLEVEASGGDNGEAAAAEVAKDLAVGIC